MIWSFLVAQSSFGLILSGIFTLFVFLFYLSRHLCKISFHLIPVPRHAKGHHWVYVPAFPAGKYCNVCETSSFHGGECDYCGIIADDGCLRRADESIACKQLACLGATMKHHWVPGNLPPRSACHVCDAPAGDGPGLQDFRCVWCQIPVHQACLEALTTICDFGRLKRMIIPPNTVKLRAVGWSGRRQFVVKEVEAPPISDWRPVLVIANRKSGNGEGELVLQAFRRVLNPAQVMDLATAPPERGLEWCRLVGAAGVRCRILVAGGDGTVGWVLSAMEDMGLHPQPEVCLLPLGTGNDLSRVLGWGAGHSGPVDAMRTLALLNAASPQRLDRWLVSIEEERWRLRRARSRRLSMSNYFSVGVDAQVTLNFHEQRFRLPSAVTGRLANKLLFFHYGARDVVERGCEGLEGQVELWLDEERVELPPLEGIVVANIASWGAGVRPWELCWCGGAHPSAALDDGLLEVMGLTSSFHIAQLQVSDVSHSPKKLPWVASVARLVCRSRCVWGKRARCVCVCGRACRCRCKWTVSRGRSRARPTSPSPTSARPSCWPTLSPPPPPFAPVFPPSSVSLEGHISRTQMPNLNVCLCFLAELFVLVTF